MMLLALMVPLMNQKESIVTIDNFLTHVNYRQVRDAVLNPDFNVCMGIII